MIRRELIHRIYIILAILTIALCACFAMQIADGEDLGATNIAKNYLLTFAVLIPGLVAFFWKRLLLQAPSLIKWLTLTFIWMAFISFTHSPNIRTSIYPILNALIPLATLQLMYTYSTTYGLKKSLYWIFVIMQLILVFQYFRIYDVANAVGEAHLMTSYYPMFVLPLVLLHPSRTVRYVSVLVVTFVIFSSVKRGGLVALVFGLIVYVLFNRHIQSKGLRSFIYMLFAFAVLGGVFYYLANSEYGGALERLASVQDDGGSGRDVVWSTTWQMIQDSEGLSFLFGHGYNGVRSDSPVYLSAHNDFLEAWYDYGISGFILYAGSMLSLLAYTIRLLKRKSELAPSLGMLLAITFILTMISHVLIFYLMSIVCMTIGIILGQDQYNSNQDQR